MEKFNADLKIQEKEIEGKQYKEEVEIELKETDDINAASKGLYEARNKHDTDCLNLQFEKTKFNNTLNLK